MFEVILLILVSITVYRSFASLAKTHKKPAAVYGIMGIILFLAGFLLSIFVTTAFRNELRISPGNMVMTLLIQAAWMGIGVLMASAVRGRLEKSWGKETHANISDSELLDD